MTHVVCVGLAVLDLVFQVETFPTAAGKHFASGLHQVGGGPAANGAVTVARLGGQASFVGAVGDDVGADRILAGLRAEGVGVDHVVRVPGATSPLSAVLVDPAGERLIVNHRDPRLHADVDLPDAAVAEADAVLGDLRWPAGAADALAVAKGSGLPAVLDYDSADLADDAALLAGATHIAFAQPALAARTGTDDPAEGLRRIAQATDAWVAVTLGGDGVVWLEPDGQDRHLAAFAVDVVETLGAGDVFHGALALHLADGVPEDLAVERASAAAALKCAHAGGRDAIPTAADVAALLAAGPARPSGTAP